MAGGCRHGPDSVPTLGVQRRLLAVVLVINALMFLVEAGAGWSAQSVSLQADALDFLGDSINYATALYVLSKPLRWRATAAFIKGLAMVGFGLFVLGASLHNALFGASPEAPVMGVVGVLALLANLCAALLLFRFRRGDANLRSVWLCSRNDAIGNLAVLAAAGGVALTGGLWPDLAVGMIMASLAVWAGQSVLRQAAGELREAQPAPAE
ncbi:MAG: cation transporter [Rhodospirillales bacterium]|nr:cation transporter [Rhodospirillales bacterium]